MKNKFISIITIFILIIILEFSNAYAADIVCSLKFWAPPNNPKPGDEITIVLSTTAINQPIASLGFSMEYDSSVIEISSAAAESGWTLTKIENFFNITTSNNESTTTIGNIVTIKLKIKESASVGTTNTIKFKSIEVAKDDASIVKIDDVTENITITQKQEDKKDEEKTEDPKNEKTQNPTGSKEEEPKETQNPTGSKEEEPKQEEIPKKDITINDEQIKTITFGSNGYDDTQKKGTLPNAGERNVVYIGVIVILAVISVVSYRIYRKNNI